MGSHQDAHGRDRRAQDKTKASFPPILAGEWEDVQLVVGELQAEVRDSILLTGGYFNRTEGAPHINFPSEA